MIFLLLLLFALFGHAAFWTGFVNRLHASAVPYRTVSVLSYAALTAVVVIPLAFMTWMWRNGIIPDMRIWGSLDALLALPFLWLFYLLVCCFTAAFSLVAWLARYFASTNIDAVRAYDSRSHCLAARSSDHAQDHRDKEYHHHPLLHLPGNQSLRIDIVERTLALERLHSNLDGFSIVHLSDLHFSGKVGKGYFEEIVQQSNELQPDMVAITGDLVDKTCYIDWIPDTLAKLNSRYGTFYVLGNHDLRVDVSYLQQTLKSAGLIYLGGRCEQIQLDKNFDHLPRENGGQTPCDSQILLAGNELPWFPPAADMSEAPPRRDDGQPLRILLTHTPDQLQWATVADFDLMLSGHLHGGQFRLPWIGPVLSPSTAGVKYACGVFYSHPTVMHVTRGISAKFPLRLNCEPELAKLVLTRPE